jgi:hypothetical protein
MSDWTPQELIEKLGYWMMQPSMPEEAQGVMANSATCIERLAGEKRMLLLLPPAEEIIGSIMHAMNPVPLTDRKELAWAAYCGVVSYLSNPQPGIEQFLREQIKNYDNALQRAYAENRDLRAKLAASPLESAS